MIREALVFHIEDLLEQGEPLPEPKMSIDEAIAYHNEPIPEDVLESCAEYGDDTPTLSTRFEFVEVEIPAPQPSEPPKPIHPRAGPVGSEARCGTYPAGSGVPVGRRFDRGAGGLTAA